MKEVVCPLCVQWVCSCSDWECYGECDDQARFVPVWADGSIATLTQDNYCERCSLALAEYERHNREEAGA